MSRHEKKCKFRIGPLLGQRVLKQRAHFETLTDSGQFSPEVRGLLSTLRTDEGGKGKFTNYVSKTEGMEVIKN